MKDIRALNISKTMTRCGLLWSRYNALITLKHPLADDFKIDTYSSFRGHFARWNKYGDDPATELLVALENPQLLFQPQYQ